MSQNYFIENYKFFNDKNSTLAWNVEILNEGNPEVLGRELLAWCQHSLFCDDPLCLSEVLLNFLANIVYNVPPVYCNTERNILGKTKKFHNPYVKPALSKSYWAQKVRATGDGGKYTV